MVRPAALASSVASIDGRLRAIAICVAPGRCLQNAEGLKSGETFRFLHEAVTAAGAQELVCFDIDDVLSALTGSMGIRTREWLRATGSTSWQGFRLEHLPGNCLTMSDFRRQLTVIEATSFFNAPLDHALRDWGVTAETLGGAETACTALDSLLATVDSQGWIHPKGLSKTITWLGDMRTQPVVLQSEDDPIPPEALRAEAPWVPCLNCGEPVAAAGWMYCDAGCTESAKAVRYARRHRDAGTIDYLDIEAAIEEKIGHAVTGGYDDARHRLSAEQRAAVFTRDDYRCRSCGRPADEIDHIGPGVEGDLNHPGNLQALCSDCHDEKTLESRRPATPEEAAKIDAIWARIYADEPTRLADRPTFDRVWRAVKARRAAIAVAVGSGELDRAQSLASAGGLSYELARRWRSGPNITAATAKALAELRIRDLWDLRGISRTELLQSARVAGITGGAVLGRLLDLHGRAITAPAHFLFGSAE